MINQISPAVILLTGALLILGGTKLARRFGLPDAFGCGVALCIIAISVWLFPADWREWATGGSRGDRLLIFLRIGGLTGMLFLAGTRFNSDRLSKKFGLMVGFALSAGVLFAVIALLLKLLGGLDSGPAVLVAATIVAGSLWLPGELSRVDKEEDDLPSDWQTGAVVSTALAMLAVYFYDIYAVIGHARAATSLAYVVMAFYESVKLIVLFAFAYFISTRFLARAEGRISAARTTIGFVLIAVLLFALAAVATNQLGAIAWAFVAGAVWRRSAIGKRFGESQRPLASATLISFVFLPVLLQSHGRRLTGFLGLVIGVLAAMVLKSMFLWVGMRLGGTSSRNAVHTATAMVGPSEVAILFLGFGMTRWAVEAPVYFGILGYALLSSLLIPLAWRFEDSDTVVSFGLRRKAMNGRIKRVVCLVVTALAIVFFSNRPSSAQQPARGPARQEIQLGSGMSVITPGLMEAGSKTKLFLLLADKIPVTLDQRKKLEGLFLEFQMYGVQREADLDVADAELKRLLTRDTIDLGVLKTKMKEIEEIRLDVDMKKIETLLKAIKMLTHEQHTQIIFLARDLEGTDKPRAPIYQ